MNPETPELLSTSEYEVRTVDPQPVTPMRLLEMAVASNVDADKLEKLVDLHLKMQARDAEQAFNVAMNRAQSALRQISTDATNPQTKSKYATYAAIDKEVRPVYSKEGFALSFDTGDSPLADHIRVICHVSHAAGFTRTYHADMPSDGKGAKGGDVMTKTHATGAGMSYGMRYLLKMIFNIAIGEYDNDGNSAGDSFDMDEDTFQNHLKAIREAATVADLQQIWTTAYHATKDQKTRKSFTDAKDNRKKDLGAK